MRIRHATVRATAIALARLYVFLAAMMFGAGLAAGALGASLALG